MYLGLVKFQNGGGYARGDRMIAIARARDLINAATPRPPDALDAPESTISPQIQILPAVETTTVAPAPVRAESIPVTQSSTSSYSSSGGGGSIIELPGSGGAAPIEDAPSNTAVDTPVEAGMSNWLMLSLLGGALFMAVTGKKTSRRKRVKRTR